MAVYSDLKMFRFWCQKVLPLVYDESISYYEVLCKMVEYLNAMISNQDFFKESLDKYGININELQEAVKELQDELDKVKNGEYISLYLNSLKKFIDDNLKEIVGRIMKYVFFGLTDDGYFIAYIPDSWNFIKFHTDMDYNSETYGHLILNW